MWQFAAYSATPQKMYLGCYIFFGGLPFHVRQLPKLSPIITDESRTSIKQILYSHSTFLSPMLKKVNPFSYTFIVIFLSFLLLFCKQIVNNHRKSVTTPPLYEYSRGFYFKVLFPITEIHNFFALLQNPLLYLDNRTAWVRSCEASAGSWTPLG